MNTSQAISVFAVWCAVAAVVAIFNTRIGVGERIEQALSPAGAIVICAIACVATYFIMGGQWR